MNPFAFLRGGVAQQSEQLQEAHQVIGKTYCVSCSPCRSLLDYSVPSAHCHSLRPPSPPAPPYLRTFKNECHCTPNHQQPTVVPHPSRFTIRQTSQSTANNCVYCCVHRQCTSHGSVSLGTHVLQLQPNIHIFGHSNRMPLHAGQHQRPPHLGPPRNIHHHRVKRPLP